MEVKYKEQEQTEQDDMNTKKIHIRQRYPEFIIYDIIYGCKFWK